MRSFVLMAVATVVAVTLTPIPEWLSKPSEWARWIAQYRVQHDLEETIRSTVFRLENARWLEFEIPADATAVRILTNAGVPVPEPPLGSMEHPREGWRYRVTYQILDEQGVALAHRDYALRTRIIWRDGQDKGQRQGVNWFTSTDLLPTQTRTIQIPFHEVSRQPAKIRLRLAESERQVREVVVRAYMKHERRDYAEPYKWSRVPYKAQQRICRATVYPPEMMSPAERRNLLRWNWSALAPLGLPDIDYVSRQMYQREDPHTDPPSFVPPEGALVCAPPWATTIALPQVKGQAQIELFLDESSATVEDGQVVVSAYQRKLGKVSEQRVRVTSPTPTTVILPTMPDGLELLELTANQRLLATVRWVADNPLEGQALFPDSSGDVLLESTAQTLRAPLLDAKDALTYDMAHVGNAPTPLRVSLRAMQPVELAMSPGDPTGNPAPARLFLPPRDVMFDWLDDHGRCVRSGVISTESLVSAYDRTWAASIPCYLTVPRHFYFSIPTHVAQIRFFSADKGLVISAFTRPPQLPRKIQIPEEQSFFHAALLNSRTWFLIRPTDDAERIAQNRYVRLSLQATPPIRHAELLAGQYEWEEFTPRESRPGRFALTRRAPEITPRPESVPSTYTELEPNRDYTFRWSQGEDAVPPRLIYAQPQRSHKPIRVWLDNALAYRFQPRALRGEVELPLPSERHGDHVLRVSCDRHTRLFVRCIETEHAPAYTKRFLYEFGPGPMRLPIVKQSAGTEHVIVRPFFPVKTTAASHLTRVVDTRSHAATQNTLSNAPRIAFAAELVVTGNHPGGPVAAWTLRHRSYDVAADLSEHSLLLDGTEMVVDQGQRCVIPLGEDLPPGPYEIVLRPMEGQAAPAFVTAYRVAPHAPPAEGPPARWRFEITLRDESTE